jgi:hypothetical protein
MSSLALTDDGPGLQATLLFGRRSVRSCTFVACGGTEFPVRLRSIAHRRPDFEYDAANKHRAVGNPHAAQQQQQRQQQQQHRADADAGCCGTSTALEAAGGWAALANMLRLQPGCQLGVRAAPYTDRLSVWEVHHPPQPTVPAMPPRPPIAIPAPTAILVPQSAEGGNPQPSLPEMTASSGPLPPAPAAHGRSTGSPCKQAALPALSGTDTFAISYLQLGNELLQQTCTAALKRSSALLLQPGRPGASETGKLAPGKRRPR